MKIIKRYLLSSLSKDVKKKILLITGPRQSGKTTLSKKVGGSFDYLNYDNNDHKKVIIKKVWDRRKNYIILDELHKMKNWKIWLKGLYDVEGIPPGILVTGSARVDIYKHFGDSLAGRYFHYRLHPLDLKEIISLKLCSTSDALKRLLKFGGFPEPFLRHSPSFYGKWNKTYMEIILRQDLFSVTDSRSITSIETLVELLKDRVGSPLSYKSLSEDLNCAPKTVKKWLEILEDLYLVFKITPWHKNIARSLLKSPKYYFYDIAQVTNSAARLENLVACSLLKEVHYQNDVYGKKYNLFYLRNVHKKEVDFFITKNNKPNLLLEVKTKQENLDEALKFFSKKFSSIPKIQLVQSIKREKTYPDKTEIRKLESWLSKLSFK